MEIKSNDLDPVGNTHTQQTDLPKDLVIYNGIVVTPKAVIPHCSIKINNGTIEAIGENFDTKTAIKSIDAHGNYILPGIIDLHSDAFEKYIEPRHGVMFPSSIALNDFDRYIVSCGITTLFLCICFQEFKDKQAIRNLDNAQTLTYAIKDFISHLNCSLKIHARIDKLSIKAINCAKELVFQDMIHLLSLMDHTPGQGQYIDSAQYQEKYSHIKDIGQMVSMRTEANNASCDMALDELLQIARLKKIPIASHDDDTAEKVQWNSAQGITISEFPTTTDALQKAQASGMYVSMGAPNILRGKSHNGNMNVLEIISTDFIPILCSDYSPMSILNAVFKIHETKDISLNESVNSVSLYPAQATKIDSFVGSIEVGKNADLIIVEKRNNLVSVVSAIVQGQEIYHSRRRTR